MARREKKPVHRVEMTEGKRNIIRQLLQEYDIETAEAWIPEIPHYVVGNIFVTTVVLGELITV